MMMMMMDPDRSTRSVYNTVTVKWYCQIATVTVNESRVATVTVKYCTGDNTVTVKCYGYCKINVTVTVNEVLQLL